MAEPSGDGSVVRYYCTAGNGMEPFLIDEVKRKLAADDVCQISGKVLFSSSATIKKVIGLKAAERLFILLKQDSPFRLLGHTSPAKAASVLLSKLLEERDEWSNAVVTWNRLQRELTTCKNSAITSSTALTVMETREVEGSIEKQREEEPKCPVESRKRTCEFKEDERLTRAGQNGMQTSEKKRKKDIEEEDKWDNLSAESNVEELTRIRNDGSNINDCRSVSHEESPVLEHNVKSSSKREDEMGKDVNSEKVSFRISCKCTGSLSRCLGAQVERLMESLREVSKVLGAGVSRVLGWKADMKSPQVEINVCLSDDFCLLGIPVTRLPLAYRSYVKTTGLRSTIAWAMGTLAEIQPGFCVVDPMCGVGSILTEAAQEHKAAWFLGVDIDYGQLKKANENIAFAELGGRINLLRASSLVLPMPSASVDAVVCDLPFGRKFGTRINMASELPLILSEFERILRIGGVLVILLSPQLSFLLKKLLLPKHSGEASHLEDKPQTGIQNCVSCDSPSEQNTSQSTPGLKSTGIQGPELQLPLSSLRHQRTLRVSLGAIDGLIHKYVKTDS